MPLDWWISRLCQEFNCLPSQALKEWRDAPPGFLEDILEARAVGEAWGTWDRATKKSQVPPSPVMDLVKELEFELVQEELAEHGRTADED